MITLIVCVFFIYKTCEIFRRDEFIFNRDSLRWNIPLASRKTVRPAISALGPKSIINLRGCKKFRLSRKLLLGAVKTLVNPFSRENCLEKVVTADVLMSRAKWGVFFWCLVPPLTPPHGKVWLARYGSEKTYVLCTWFYQLLLTASKYVRSTVVTRNLSLILNKIHLSTFPQDFFLIPIKVISGMGIGTWDLPLINRAVASICRLI